jgi:aspartate-semialdehyde dehydrogenase
MQKMKVGIIGATGMVGQRFLTLLDGHPYFEVSVLAASAQMRLLPVSSKQQ